MINLLVFSIGVFSVAWWPSLPKTVICLSLLVCLLPLWRVVQLRAVLWAMAGITWGVMCAHQTSQSLLPEALDGEEVLLTGTIVSLVDRDSRRSRFSFRPLLAHLIADSRVLAPPSKLLLSWYGSAELHAGQQWRFVARLRRPRGFVNPAGFDYQRWLVHEGYSATGYIREGYVAEQLPQTGPFFTRLEAMPHELRELVRNTLTKSQLSERGQAVLLALTIGDKQQLGDWWKDLARMGIVHLLVISGLHVGLIAVVGALLGKLLVRLLLVLWHLGGRFGLGLYRSPDLSSLAPLIGWCAAAGYSLLAGFSLPTQRALIAVTVVVVARLAYRKLAPVACFLWALLLIALSQPLAALSAGFWLSFSAVGILVAWFSPWRSADSWFQWKRGLTAQFALLVGMSVPLLVFIGKLSWLSPVVNIFAVPWVSFITVPLALLGCLLLLVSSDWAGAAWRVAEWSVDQLWRVLGFFPADSGFVSLPLGTSIATLAAVLFAVIMLLLPKGVPLRWLGLLPLGLQAAFAAPEPPLRVVVLDVGQGLAVVVETPNHSAVYDTGSEFSDRFSAGDGIIAPYLWSRGRAKIDATIVSHEDGDHAGGFASLQQSIASRQLMTGPAVNFAPEVVDDSLVRHCRSGQSWRWDAVEFSILSPPDKATVEIESGNNSSCVVQIRWRDVTVLLPGDIERRGEILLATHDGLSSAPIDLLVAPHHGSKTSSTAGFVHRLAPEHVVFSAGYKHQFGHPHATVVDRYRTAGTTLWRTAEQGAVVFTWSAAGELSVETAREHRRWWR